MPRGTAFFHTTGEKSGLDAKNAAKYLGLAGKTLAMKRVDGTGPRFVKRGKVFYYIEDLDAWLNAGGRVASTAQLRTIEG